MSTQPPPNEGDSRWLTAVEAGEYLNYAPYSILRFCKQGKLRYARAPGGKTTPYRFRREWLDDFLYSRQVEPTRVIVPARRSPKVVAGSVEKRYPKVAALLAKRKKSPAE